MVEDGDGDGDHTLPVILGGKRNICMRGLLYNAFVWDGEGGGGVMGPEATGGLGRWNSKHESE